MQKLVFLVLIFFAPLSFSQDVVETGINGSVNWSKGIIYAKGYGTAKEGLPAAQRKLLSRRAAIVDAQRNLLEMTKGVRITSMTKVVNAMFESSITASKVEGMIKGAAPVSGEYEDDIFTVTMAMAIGGELLSAVYEKPVYSFRPIVPTKNDEPLFNLLNQSVVALESFLISSAMAEEIFVIEGDVEAETARKIIEWIKQQHPADISASLKSAVKQYESGNFTGLLIDASNVPGFELATIPKIRDEEGNVIYPNESTSYSDIVNKRGVTYDLDIKDAVLNKRVSMVPLVVTALSTYKNLNSDLVINQADAQKIQSSASIRLAMMKAGVLIVVSP